MRLVVTGGGTGGHVYPALEVARLARERGAELLYLGSLRGQEGRICKEKGILFEGFASEPLYSLRTPKGWKALMRLMLARSAAKTRLKAAHPDVVFSTGGYSAAPVVAAARALKIPYVIHEGNSMPGRANRMFAGSAKAFLSTFRTTEKLFTERKVERTGQPIRQTLRDESSKPRDRATPMVLVVGGSQGSAFLNSAVPAAAILAQDIEWLHVTGRTNIDTVRKAAEILNLRDGYKAEPYLEAKQMAEAYRRATVVVARSGSTLAELALFRIPSVLVPLPTSADNHQLHNANEFAEMKAATVLEQHIATPESLAEAAMAWVSDAPGRDLAAKALEEWDIPDATERIWSRVEAATR